MFPFQTYYSTWFWTWYKILFMSTDLLHIDIAYPSLVRYSHERYVNLSDIFERHENPLSYWIDFILTKLELWKSNMNCIYELDYVQNCSVQSQRMNWTCTITVNKEVFWATWKSFDVKIKSNFIERSLSSSACMLCEVQVSWSFHFSKVLYYSRFCHGWNKSIMEIVVALTPS